MSKTTPYWQLAESVWDQLTCFDQPERFLEQFKVAPEIERNLFAAHWCEAEVCNGGFLQFFDNSTGILGPEALEAFQKIGMPQVARLVAEGVAWFGPTFPRGWEDRRNLIDAYCGNPFDHLDEPFFHYIRNENGGFEEAAQAYADSKLN